MNYKILLIVLLSALNSKAQTLTLPAKFSACHNTQTLTLGDNNRFEYKKTKLGKTDGFVSAEIYKGDFEYNEKLKTLTLKITEKLFKESQITEVVKIDKQEFVFKVIMDKVFKVYCFSSDNSNCNLINTNALK